MVGRCPVSEMPYVIKAVFFTLTPIFYVLVDSLLVDPFFDYVYPTVRNSFARALLWVIRLKYILGQKRKIRLKMKKSSMGGVVREATRKNGGSSNGVAPNPVRGWRDVDIEEDVPMSDESIEDGLRYELGDGIMDILSLQTPVEAVEEMTNEARGWMKHVLTWSKSHVHRDAGFGDEGSGGNNDKGGRGNKSGGGGGGGGGESELTFGQKMKKHFFEARGVRDGPHFNIHACSVFALASSLN